MAPGKKSHYSKHYKMTENSLNSSFIKTMNSVDMPRSIISPIDESMPNAESDNINRES